MSMMAGVVQGPAWTHHLKLQIKQAQFKAQHNYYYIWFLHIQPPSWQASVQTAEYLGFSQKNH